MEGRNLKEEGNKECCDHSSILPTPTWQWCTGSLFLCSAARGTILRLRESECARVCAHAYTCVTGLSPLLTLLKKAWWAILKHTLQDLDVTGYCLSRWIQNFLGIYKVSAVSQRLQKSPRQKLVTSNLRWVLKISTQSAWIPQQHDILLIREHNKLGQLYVGFGLSNTMIVEMKNSVLKVINCRHLMELATAIGIWYMISWACKSCNCLSRCHMKFSLNFTCNNGVLVNMTKS